ncbi:SRPBCC family protein [Marinoscillum sp.]|uniref:SRPBCC family protein n=1 Tax=Marinoscillum sp. TaxID=2024838 RepID=UPI003BA9FFDF
MRLKIETKVFARLDKVSRGFNQQLFKALNPPFPPVKLLEFGGCEKGDRVVLELNFLLFKQIWQSGITDHGESEREWYFVDEGVKLPFFLKTWRHRHVVQSTNTGSVIIDDIQFSTGTIVTDFIMYPVLFAQFLYRKPVYKKVFKQKEQP